MFVVEALASTLFEAVLDKLVATPLLDYARRLKVDIAVLQEWRRTLLHLQAVVRDAERRQIRDDAVKRWLIDLRALAYDIEDVLDEFDAEAKEHPRTRTSKVRELITTSFHSSSRRVTFKEKIEKISQELEAIKARKSDFQLMTEESAGGGVSSLTQQRLTTSFVKGNVYGRKDDFEKIMELLLSDQVTNADKVQVISIVGMGGVGKTTLAQQIYDDDMIKKSFTLTIWVCVSDQFDLERITKAILDDSSNNSTTLQSLQKSLQTKLNGKRFFLVLDDVWNEDPISWATLQAPLSSGAPGSVVLVTTRHEHVAAIMRTTLNSHHLSKLSEEDCWSLFEHIAFDNMAPDACQSLVPIGKEIVKKCNGLPLAATTMAGLLRCQQDVNTWKNMLKNDIWELSTAQSRILPVLHLSYHYLPTNLKECFAYCSIFPKDYEFRKEELILLWMAQGLVGNLKGGVVMEDVGEICFQNLFSRSFFQRSPRNESLFVMHDLIHDLAQFVYGEFCFGFEGGKHNYDPRLTRHVSYLRERFEISKRFDPLERIDKLRTFLSLGKSLYGSTYYLADKVPHHLLSNFRCLRVLSLSNYDITYLPESFGKYLKQLRYLNLSHTKIQKLPKSIGKLVNLQSLILSNCYVLTQLPPEMGKLVNLRHLDISDTKLECMPMEINRLKDLRRLTAFVVSKHGGANIMELRHLSHLHGALSLLNLQNVVNTKDALEANLKEKEGLDELTFMWNPNAGGMDSTNQTRVLENLKPHNKLKRLRIQNYHGTKFPKWLGHPSFKSLVLLQLTDCKSCQSLPSLGQLQCLEILRFEEMMEWEEWACSGVEFPCLKELYMWHCPKLKGDMPKRLPLLTRLEISRCGQLACHLPTAPSICELKLNNCNEVMLRSAGSLISLTHMEVSHVCEIPVEWGQLQHLVHLSVDVCPNLEEIPPILQYLSSLKSLRISKWERLSSFLETGLPPMLETLDISSCYNLESLPDGMMRNNSALQNLSFFSCFSLRCFPMNIDSLKKLSIWGCGKLELSLPEERMHNSYASLTSLFIRCAFDSLTSFPLLSFPNLESLNLESCGNLECLYIPQGIHHMGLTSLKKLVIRWCPNLESFPEGGLHTPNLTDLSIDDCKKLRSLPRRMHSLLTSLQSLSLNDCPEIVSFPEGGLPLSLSTLGICNCTKLMASRMEWRLDTLPYLTALLIGGLKEERILESLPDQEEPFLPSSLTCLAITESPNLKSLDDMGLEHLPSLQTLGIMGCGELQSIPKLGLSLQTLEIEGCEKLESFPKQGLPTSLSRLQIEKCPLLQKRCQRDKGKLWPTISHVPCIIIGSPIVDGEVILS